MCEDIENGERGVNSVKDLLQTFFISIFLYAFFGEIIILYTTFLYQAFVQIFYNYVFKTEKISFKVIIQYVHNTYKRHLKLLYPFYSYTMTCMYICCCPTAQLFFSLGFYMQYYVDKSLIRVLYAAITLPIILILKLSGKNVKIVHNKKGPYKKVQ